jgi:hypothetical protein
MSAMRREVKSVRRKAFLNRGRFLFVETEDDAHAAREHLDMEAFVFDRLTEQPPPGGLNGSALGVSVLHIGFLGAAGVVASTTPSIAILALGQAIEFLRSQ